MPKELAQFWWLLFLTEELNSAGNQAVTVHKTCTRLLVASQKPRSNPSPRATECKKHVCCKP